MSAWESSAAGAPGWNDDGATASAPGWNDTGASANASGWNGNGFAGAVDSAFDPSFKDDNQDDNDNKCRFCSEEGHFARDCPNKPARVCFNCNKEGHSKADCTEPAKARNCRLCEDSGHLAAACPKRTCRNCSGEGHDAQDCKTARVLNNDHVPVKSESEAWAMLEEASNDRDIADFKEAVQILSKAAPAFTYPELEKEFRDRKFNIYLIAMEKEHGPTWTNVTLQGDIGKKYTVAYFTSDKAQRPSLVSLWPQDAEENMRRLADAGIPLDRGVMWCTNCRQVGHTRKGCTEEREEVEGPKILCHICNEEGHRVRDCTQVQEKQGRACKICESQEHLAKDCPNKPVRACRNCGGEDHMAKECPEPRKIICSNCDEEGHMRKDCTKKKDWSRITCQICNEKGHSRYRCPQAPADGEENNAGSAGHGKANGATKSGGNDWEGGGGADSSGANGWGKGTETTGFGGNGWTNGDAVSSGHVSAWETPVDASSGQW